MKKKAIFLDLDGTVLDHDDVLYDSAKNAIIKAMENGHKIFLCTGREKSFVSKKIFDIGVTDGVFCAGAHVTCGDETLHESSFSPNQYDKIIEVLKKHKACFGIESQEGELLPAGMFKDYPHYEAALLAIGAKIIDKLPESADDIDKVIYVEADCHVDEMQKELEGICQVIASSYVVDDHSGEIMQTGLNKAVGIKKILAHCGIDEKDTIGIGDSNNDFEMVEFCNLGIAMGNASDKLKSLANYITTDIKQDGLYNAFKFAELI